jgi:uncharacterized protein (TIGR02284 family)
MLLLMETKELTERVLNDLIRVNNERIHVYARAMEELKEEDADLKVLFTKMISNSHQYKIALAKEVSVLIEEVIVNSSTRENIFDAWMNVRSVFSGHDRKTILANCKLGEDNTQKAYETALQYENISKPIRRLISDQKLSIQASRNTITLLCDSQVHIMMLGYI